MVGVLLGFGPGGHRVGAFTWAALSGALLVLSFPSVGHPAAAWVALTPSTRENGCVQVLPGSHAAGQRAHRDARDERAMLSRGQTLAEAVDDGDAVDLLLAPGEVSQRGDVVDVFALGSPRALRLEFFDDVLDSIRHFDPASQCSLAVLENADLALGSATKSDVVL